MKKRFTKEEKLKIVLEAQKQGTEITIRKYGVYQSTFYTWRKKYRNEGEGSLERKKRTTKDDHYIKKLEDEVGLFKQLLAEREMELALKDELLKKKYPWARKKL